ncbi:MAG TPA: hypothetical protein EYQ14_24645 [Gammaproteobacteria bacterium]|nr:hypothetical protein [Gammaproteobacteria bacterium]HIL97682.1 hypothetical protein [Pseudomonadales bacterium]
MNLKIYTLLVTIQFLAGCASGSSIVVGEVKTPIEPSQVILYLEVPDNYEIIGIVNASSDSGWTQQGSVDYAVQELKNQAAKLGANGILIETTAEQTYTLLGGQGDYTYAVPVTAKTVSGKAIFVKVNGF